MAIAASKSILSEALDHRLKMYSLAAAAAGVSMLALGRPAQAEVVVTAKNLTVDNSNPSVYIKMTGEGGADFELVWVDGYPRRYFEITPLPGGEIVGVTPNTSFYASRLLGPGAVVGPLSPFGGQGGALIAATSRSSYTFCSQGPYGVYCHTTVLRSSHFGFWNPWQPPAYIGVRFTIDGRIHYGWIRLAANVGTLSDRITAYAYETEPDTPLIVPPASSDDADPNTVQEDHSLGKAAVGGPSLGMLALGAHGLPLWRREEALAY
jgi:hypothetical protein